MELQDLHIQEDYSEDNELEEAIWKHHQTKQTERMPTDVDMFPYVPYTFPGSSQAGEVKSLYNYKLHMHSIGRQ